MSLVRDKVSPVIRETPSWWLRARPSWKEAPNLQVPADHNAIGRYIAFDRHGDPVLGTRPREG